MQREPAPGCGDARQYGGEGVGGRTEIPGIHNRHAACICHAQQSAGSQHKATFLQPGNGNAVRRCQSDVSGHGFLLVPILYLFGIYPYKSVGASHPQMPLPVACQTPYAARHGQSQRFVGGHRYAQPVLSAQPQIPRFILPCTVEFVGHPHRQMCKWCCPLRLEVEHEGTVLRECQYVASVVQRQGINDYAVLAQVRQAFGKRFETHFLHIQHSQYAVVVVCQQSAVCHLPYEVHVVVDKAVDVLRIVADGLSVHVAVYSMLRANPYPSVPVSCGTMVEGFLFPFQKTCVACDGIEEPKTVFGAQEQCVATGICQHLRRLSSRAWNGMGIRCPWGQVK